MSSKRLVSTFVPRFVRRISILLVFLSSLAAATTECRAWPAPDTWGGDVSAGYDRRDHARSWQGDPNLGTGDARFWYAKPVDAGGQVDVWGRWKYKLAGQSQRAHLEYQHFAWAEGAILAHDVFGGQIQHKLGGTARIEGSAELVPRRYVRHRLHKSASPGEPRYRPESYSKLDLDLRLAHAFIPALEYELGVFSEARDESRWFDERDRTGVGGAVGLNWSFGEQSRFEPAYAYTTTDPEHSIAGTDLGQREHEVAWAVRTGVLGFGGPWKVDLTNTWQFRRYRTGDPGDSRYHRRDRIYSWSAKVRRVMPIWAPFLAAESGGRWVSAPGIADAAEDDGAAERTLIRLGVEWEY